MGVNFTVRPKEGGRVGLGNALMDPHLEDTVLMERGDEVVELLGAGFGVEGSEEGAVVNGIKRLSAVDGDHGS